MNKGLLALLAVGSIGCSPEIDWGYLHRYDPIYVKENEHYLTSGFYEEKDRRCVRTVYIGLERGRLQSFLQSLECDKPQIGERYFHAIRSEDTDADGKIDQDCIITITLNKNNDAKNNEIKINGIKIDRNNRLHFYLTKEMVTKAYHCFAEKESFESALSRLITWAKDGRMGYKNE